MTISEPFGQALGDRPLVVGVGVGVEQADRDGLDAPEALGQPVEVRLCGGQPYLAGRRDAIDALVPPGTTIGPDDVGYVPPALTDPALRRR